MLNSMEAILRAAKAGKKGVVSVAAAHDEEVLRAVRDARHEGIADSLLVGDAARIEEILQSLGENAAS